MARELRSTLKINYKDVNDTHLGCYEYTDFDEILIPDFKKSFDHFLNLKFASQSNFIWRIIDIDASTNLILNITLEPIRTHSPLNHSLGQMVNTSTVAPNRYVREFSIVEVEFGFFESIYNGTAITTNRKYTNSLLSGEIHKRRPCIILSFHNQFAKVIPLTTKTDKLTHVDIPINLNAITDLAIKYHCTTHALLNLIQPVSYDRIYAPFLASGGAHFTRFQTLTMQDQATLTSTLPKVFKIDTELSILKAKVDILSQERYAHIDKFIKKNEELNKMSAYLLQLGTEVGEGETLSEIIESLQKRQN